MKLLVKFLPIVFSVILVLIFFWQFFFKGLLPIPADTIVGLYHPYRDLYAKEYPRGIPFKNFLITDPVRQQYPWKHLSIDLLKRGELPLWNPYSFSGTPLLANFQSAVFYPLNIIFFILPFNIAWSFLIVLEVFLGLIFMFLYLNNLKLNKWSSILGSVVFSFSGFSTAWLEWGNILHTSLWLPLILLSIDKILIVQKSKIEYGRLKFVWGFIFIFSLISSFFAGHLQIFFYLFILSMVYFLYRWIERGRNKQVLIQFTIYYLLFTIITAVQWVPTLSFISESARSLDQSYLKEGWFIPWQHLLQFVVPDFFGNPTTLNYWGVFNYAEFIGYIGIAPLILAVFALFFRKDKNTFLFGSIFFLGLIFSLPTIFAKLPYILDFPLISTAQPTRLLLIVDFSLAILCALGFNLLFERKMRKKIIYPVIFLTLILVGLWTFALFGKNTISPNDLSVAKHNLIPASVLFLLFGFLFLIPIILKSKPRLVLMVYIIVVVITVIDLFRFGWKFTPFTKNEYLFPNTKILSFLQDQNKPFRVMTTDSRIFAPNFSDVYKIESIDGYDPLYIQRYAELVAAAERGEPNISPPFGFNRIITPHNFDSKIIDLLGVKYILSLSDLSSGKLIKAFEEGQAKVYINKNAFPRAFFVNETITAKNKKDAVKLVFEKDLSNTAVVEDFKSSMWGRGEVQIQNYNENKITLKTQNEKDGFLVLTDTFYSAWRARVDGEETKIYRTDYNLRGIIVPKGEHKIEFYVTLF